MDYKDLLQPDPTKGYPTSTPPNIIPGGRYGQDMGAEIADAYAKGGVGAAAGMTARTALGAPLAVAADVMNPVSKLAFKGLDSLGTGVKNGARALFTGRSGQQSEATSALPPITQNAISNVAAAAPASNQSNESNQSVRVGPRPGPVSKPGDNVYPNSSKVDMTNAYGSNSPQGYPNITFNAPPSGGGGGGVGTNVGLLPPEFHSQIAELLDSAKPLLNSRGIVDRMRGRQLLKARDRLISGATNIAGSAIGGANTLVAAQNAQTQQQAVNTNAFRASNEVPLAMLNSATQKYSTDVSANTSRGNAELAATTSRYNTDESRASARYGIDARTALELPRAQRDDMVNQAITSGQMDQAGEIATIDRRAPQVRESGWTMNPMGTGGTRIRPDGRTEALTYGKDGTPKIHIVGENIDGNKVRSAGSR